MLTRSQSRSESMLEAGANVALGFVLALLTQALVYPLFGIRTSVLEDGAIVVVFTGVSLVRSYLVRRAFETFGQPARPRQGASHART